MKQQLHLGLRQRRRVAVFAIAFFPSRDFMRLFVWQRLFL